MVTEVVPQVADGIEGVAVHPSGKFAVLSCLEDSPRVVNQAYVNYYEKHDGRSY